MKSPVLLHNYLEMSCEKFPDKEALIFRKQRYTYLQFDHYSNLLALALIKAGIKRQDRVVIYLENSPEIIFSVFGILKAGAIFSVINAATKPHKLAYILNDSQAKVLITDSGRFADIVTVADKCISPLKVLWTGDKRKVVDGLAQNSLYWNDILSPEMLPITQYYAVKSELVQLKPRCIDLDLASLIYTSGTTGDPKGIMSTHRNMISACKSIIEYLENRGTDIILNTLPLSFDYGLYQNLMAVVFGGTVVLEKSFVFVGDILKIISREKVTGFPIVPTILSMLSKLKNTEESPLRLLRYITNTGAALSVGPIRKFRNDFPDVRIYSMFGLTECKRISYLPPELIDEKPESVGIPMPNCEVFVVDEHGNEVEAEEIGELIVRGSNVMQGYWNSEEMTRKTYRPWKNSTEKYLFTGDYFKKDKEGFLYFLGRKDDMIKSRGERIYPKEIENIILQLEGVLEVAVIGVPDEVAGNFLKAFIVTKDDTSLSSNEIINYCVDNLEFYSVPKFIQFADELPKTAHGKIDKKKLSTSYG